MSDSLEYVTASHEKKPSEIYDKLWIYQDAPESCENRGDTLGKWLIFKKTSKIDETWEEVRKLVESGELGATAAKVSTMKDNPNASNKRMKVICVYTTKEDIDDIGLKLIQVIKHTIKYKTDEATLAGKYSWSNTGKPTCRTLEWNDGNPVFTN